MFADSEISVAQVLARVERGGMTVGLAAKVMSCSTVIAKMGLLLLDPPVF